MKYELLASPDIFEKYPQYNALVIYAQGLSNGASSESITKILREAENMQRSNFEGQKASSHPHISAWREAFRDFGAKPSKYLCSAEALLSRTLKGEDLPEVNQLVDLYNALSVKHVIPFGGEDWDKLTSNLVLKFASGEEPFITTQGGEEVIDHPKPGEVVWADDSGVTCRRWNWRQCTRTQLVPTTRNAYFVLDALPPYSRDELMQAASEFIDLLKQFSPECKTTHEFLEAST